MVFGVVEVLASFGAVSLGDGGVGGHGPVAGVSGEFTVDPEESGVRVPGEEFESRASAVPDPSAVYGEEEEVARLGPADGVGRGWWGVVFSLAGAAFWHGGSRWRFHRMRSGAERSLRVPRRCCRLRGRSIQVGLG